jgi:hypothetical protein
MTIWGKYGKQNENWWDWSNNRSLKGVPWSQHGISAKRDGHLLVVCSMARNAHMGMGWVEVWLPMGSKSNNFQHLSLQWSIQKWWKATVIKYVNNYCTHANTHTYTYRYN